MWPRIINIIIGLFLMFAPALWHFDKKASDNHYIVGPLVLTFAITALWEVNRNVRLFNTVAGAWLLFSPLILGLKGTVALIDTFTGILIILFSIFKGTIKKRYGGGWRSLIQKNPVHMEEASRK
jgi:hypothetical protein